MDTHHYQHAFDTGLVSVLTVTREGQQENYHWTWLPAMPQTSAELDEIEEEYREWWVWWCSKFYFDGTDENFIHRFHLSFRAKWMDLRQQASGPMEGFLCGEG